MVTSNYRTIPVAFNCHCTKPADMWENPQNRSRVCFAEAVKELRILNFFELNTAICNHAITVI
jgi:hypothetical protein